jgi:RNA polymerase sigma-70 factor (ECF subfamily)
MTRDDFNEYVRQLSRKLYGYAFRILLKQEEAEDAVQEIFIKLWNMGGKLDDYISIEALSTTMIKNYCIDQLRKQKHIIYDQNYYQDYHNITAPSPHEQMVRRESDDIIRKIIEYLPDLYKVIIKLHDIEGYSYDEISEKTGQNINTLRVTLSRARGLVRDEYKKYHNDAHMINNKYKQEPI